MFLTPALIVMVPRCPLMSGGQQKRLSDCECNPPAAFRPTSDLHGLSRSVILHFLSGMESAPSVSPSPELLSVCVCGLLDCLFPSWTLLWPACSGVQRAGTPYGSGLSWGSFSIFVGNHFSHNWAFSTIFIYKLSSETWGVPQLLVKGWPLNIKMTYGKGLTLFPLRHPHECRISNVRFWVDVSLGVLCGSRLSDIALVSWCSGRRRSADSFIERL